VNKNTAPLKSYCTETHFCINTVWNCTAK